MLNKRSCFGTSVLLAAMMAAPAAVAQPHFVQDVTISKLYQPDFQRRVLVGSELKPWRFGIVETGMGIFPGPTPWFTPVDVAAFTVDINDRFSGPANLATLSYNGYEREGLLGNLPLDQFAPDYDFPPPPDDIDEQAGEQYGEDFVLKVTPDFTGFVAGQRAITGIVMAENGFAFDWNDHDVNNPGPPPVPFDPYDPGSVYVNMSNVMSGPAGSPAFPFARIREDVRVLLVETIFIENTTLSTVSGPGDPATHDAGRHMTTAVLGQLTVGDNNLNGGGSRIIVQGRNTGGKATLAPGLVLESSTDSNFTFEGSGETFDLDVRRGIAGAYDFTGPNTIALPSDNGTPDGNGGTTFAYGDAGMPLITGEDLAGGALDLSGVTLSVKGVALIDRVLFDAELELGRVVIDAPVQQGVQTGSAFVTTINTDEQATRLQLGVSEHGGGTDLDGRALLAAQIAADTGFTGFSNETTGENRAEVLLEYELDGDAPLGVAVSEMTDIGSAITTLENGGLGLDGQTVQTALMAGISYTPVESNRMLVEDVVVVGLDVPTATPIIGPFVNASVTPEFSSDTHTDITPDAGFELAVEVVQTPGQGVQLIQTESLSVANGRIVPEGLAGEMIEDATYDVNAIVLQEAVTRPVTTGSVGNGEQIWIQNDASGDPGIQAAAQLVDIAITGGDAGRFDVELQPGDDGLANAGGLMKFDVAFDFAGTEIAPGGFDRLYSATATIHFDDALPTALASTLGLPDASLIATPLVDAREAWSRSWQLRQLIQAPPDPGGNETDNDFEGEGMFDQNFDFRDGPIFMVGDGVTSVTIADSNPLTAVTNVAIEILVDPARDPQGGTGPASSIPTQWRDASDYGCTLGDFVQIQGLDGELFVLEMTYSDAEREAAAPNVPEFRAQINWLDVDAAPPAWVNAVLGNSDIDSYTPNTVTVDGITVGMQLFLNSRRHLMSYDDYLALNGGEPTLGDFGVDTINNVMWSVIDHNSVFAAAIQPPALPGDTDGDGDIDDADLGTAFANYTGPLGAAGGKSAAQGDTDGDGDIDDADLGNIFSAYTGPLTDPTSIPEPASLTLLLGAGLLATRRRR